MDDRQDVFKVKTQKIIYAKKWKILRLLSRVHEFPRYMPNVKQCTVLEKGPCRAVTQWSVEIDKIPLHWKEADHFDLENFSIQFEALEGDLELFKGEWKLEDNPSGGVEVTVCVELKVGIPLIEKVIGDVISEKIKKNFDLMLNAIDELVTMRRYKGIGFRRSSDVRGFAVIGHPYNMNHLIRYLTFFKPDFKPPSEELLARLFELTPSYRSYDIRQFKAESGRTTDGFFIMCPIIPDMLSISPEKVVEKVIQACKVGEKLGAAIATLGGFTSIAGEQYSKALLSAVNMPVTTGNTLTVGFVLEGVHKAAELMGLDLAKARLAVIGGTGDIGSACARILGNEVAEVTITSRSEKNLMDTERVLSYYCKATIKTQRDNNEAVRNADIIIAAASASSSIVDFKNFKPGAIVCDVGYPKNISYTCNRTDILIFSGGITSLPDEFNLGFDLGLPSIKVLYGCFAEAIVLDLEERYENYSWGKGNITKEKVDFVLSMAHRHGFKLAPFFWGIRLLQEKDIENIRKQSSVSIAKNGF